MRGNTVAVPTGGRGRAGPRGWLGMTREGLSAPHTKAGRTQRAVLHLLNRHAADDYGLPTTIRFVFYELEQAGLATKPRPDDTRRNRAAPRVGRPASRT